MSIHIGVILRSQYFPRDILFYYIFVNKITLCNWYIICIAIKPKREGLNDLVKSPLRGIFEYPISFWKKSFVFTIFIFIPIVCVKLPGSNYTTMKRWYSRWRGKTMVRWRGKTMVRIFLIVLQSVTALKYKRVKTMYMYLKRTLQTQVDSK